MPGPSPPVMYMSEYTPWGKINHLKHQQVQNTGHFLYRSLSIQVTVYCQEFLCVTSSISIVFLNQFNLFSLQFTCEYVLKYTTILSSIERTSVPNLATRAPDSPGFTAVLINSELSKHKGTKFALGTRLVGTSPRFLTKSPCKRFLRAKPYF